MRLFPEQSEGSQLGSPHWLRLEAIKSRHDPDDLFIVHHGVGSEQRWLPTDHLRHAIVPEEK
jgi:hypothetical protein